MKKVVTSAAARTDLVQIWLYVARDNEQAADRVLDKISEKFELLSELNELGTRCDELLPDLRFSTVFNYVIYYRPIEDGIEVLRVVHGAQSAKSVGL